LDEYWNRLEKMGESWLSTTDIHTIYISNVEMKKERMAALVAMFLSGRATNSSGKVLASMFYAKHVQSRR
jgi:hypothetical protein